MTLRWRPYEFSLRWGRQNDPLLCGQTGIAIHGPIGWVPDEFIHLDTPFEGAAWYLWSSLESPRRQETRLAVGTRAGCEVWLNGRSILTRQEAKPEVRGGNWNFRHYPSATHTAPIVLEHGRNPFLLKLRGAGPRTMVRAFVALGKDLQDAPERPLLEMPSGDASYVASGLVASRWYARSRPARFDLYVQQPPRAMWYRFVVPPGLEAMKIIAHGQPRVWVDGRKLSVRVVEDVGSPAKTHEGASVYRASADRPFSAKTTAAICLVPRVGFYAGAAMPEPVRFECGTGQASLGDWSGLGLSTYSGAARYTKAVALPDTHIGKQVLLSLGDVAAAARVLVNGQEAGTCLGRPWQIDISGFVRAGRNRIEIVVANTLASHYSVGMPCGKRYVRPGQTRAGLFGPVTIQIRSKPSA